MKPKTYIILLVFIFAYSNTCFGSGIVLIKAQNVSCNGKNDGKLEIKIPAAHLNYKIALKSIKNNSTTYIRDYSDSLFVAENLSGGAYQIKITSENLELKDTTVFIEEPQPLQMKKIKVIQPPSSENSSDGMLLAQAYGGITPYTYTWSENTGMQETDTAKNLPFGIYTCTVTDASRCEVNSTRMVIYFFKDALKNINEER